MIFIKVAFCFSAILLIALNWQFRDQAMNCLAIIACSLALGSYLPKRM